MLWPEERPKSHAVNITRREKLFSDAATPPLLHIKETFLSVSITDLSSCAVRAGGPAYGADHANVMKKIERSEVLSEPLSETKINF
jgi:hypothetical protein